MCQNLSFLVRCLLSYSPCFGFFMFLLGCISSLPQLAWGKGFDVVLVSAVQEIRSSPQLPACFQSPTASSLTNKISMFSTYSFSLTQHGVRFANWSSFPGNAYFKMTHTKAVDDQPSMMVCILQNPTPRTAFANWSSFR
jgi:hypothetical protein